tara:strand:+ start:2500 stop:2721 length:222 start_codon:yes stop_codon:yes gene_type:complete
MPTKLQKSQVTRDRNTGQFKTQHFYIKNISKTELIEKYNADNTKPKVKQKIKNELVRRGGVRFYNESEKQATA